MPKSSKQWACEMLRNCSTFREHIEREDTKEGFIRVIRNECQLHVFDYPRVVRPSELDIDAMADNIIRTRKR
jgi:hypothetical protein